MIEPVLGALAWLAKEILSVGISILVNRAADHPRLGGRRTVVTTPVRRHDLSAGAVTSDVDIVVGHLGPAASAVAMLGQASDSSARQPVLLAFQDVTDPSGGVLYPMVLGDTAHVTMPRGNYLISALVLTLPGQPGDLPLLRAVGWANSWIAANRTERITIGTQAPTAEIVRRLGLLDHDGAPLFRLRSGAFFATPRPALPTGPSPVPKAAAAGQVKRCRAKDIDGRCVHLTPYGLCFAHRQAAKQGVAVFDHRTGEQILVAQ